MSKPLKEEPISVRIRLSLLWTAVMFCYIYGDYFALYIPGKAKGLVNGDNLLNAPLHLFSASVLLAIPPTVIAISALGKATITRFANILAGLVFTAIMLLIALSYIPVQPWDAAYVFYAVLESVLTLLIVRISWRWPTS